MGYLRVLVVVALVSATVAHADEPQPARTDAPKLVPYKIVLVGDSTMAPNSGWGGAFCAHHVKWKIACINLARGARSTRSFRSEGAWDLALDEMKVPGYKTVYVLIQMGHNDQARNKPERWTEETTEFPDNLRRFVKEARTVNAVPILVTPLSRRDFKAGKVDNTLASWSDQVRQVARETSAPLIDLNARSAQFVQKLGPVKAMELAQLPPDDAAKAAAAKGTTLPAVPNPPSAVDDSAEDAGKTGARGQIKPKFDYTHVGPKGAEIFASMVTEDLGKLAPELGAMLIP